MMSQFRSVAVIGKYHTTMPNTALASSRQVLEGIASFLSRQGLNVTVEVETSSSMGISGYPTLDIPGIGQGCDLALVVGGDGTMLGVGRQLACHGVPLIGINQGRLGFITDIPLENYAQTLVPMLHGEYEEDHRSLMHAKVMRGGECVFDALAMNDVVLNRGATSGMVEFRVEVDGHFVANQRADGMIISSPTGSTADSLSSRGQLVYPCIPGLVLVPFAPHTLSNRPIVLANASDITIELVARLDTRPNYDMPPL